ncbi:MAG: BrnT family toxin [Acetobacteraceae bacterium]
MEFEWDEAKRDANLAKHGIDFVRARRVLEGPNERFSGRRVGAELRMRALALLNGVLVTVIYAVRGDSDTDHLRTEGKSR